MQYDFVLRIRITILAHYMGTRIHVVLPDGIEAELVKEAKKQGRSKSNLAMNFVIQGLNKCKEEKK